MKDFRNKVVVITGAGAGMGRAYAQEFARLGARVALNDASREALEQTRATLGMTSPEDLLLGAFDVSDEAAMRDFAQQVQGHFGNAHVVINNAGIAGVGKPVAELTPADFERLMRVNFFGVLHGTKAFLPQLLAHDEAALVNVSSVFGLIGMPGVSDYCASKFAVRGFTESLMVEMQGSPVTVHLVHPGGVRTAIAASSPDGAEFTERYLKTEPVEVARRVIRGIRSGEQRIVFGHGARKVWLLSWAASLERRNRILFAEMKKMLARR